MWKTDKIIPSLTFLCSILTLIHALQLPKLDWRSVCLVTLYGWSPDYVIDKDLFVYLKLKLHTNIHTKNTYNNKETIIPYVGKLIHNALFKYKSNTLCVEWKWPYWLFETKKNRTSITCYYCFLEAFFDGIFTSIFCSINQPLFR